MSDYITHVIEEYEICHDDKLAYVDIEVKDLRYYYSPAVTHLAPEDCHPEESELNYTWGDIKYSENHKKFVDENPEEELNIEYIRENIEKLVSDNFDDNLIEYCQDYYTDAHLDYCEE